MMIRPCQPGRQAIMRRNPPSRLLFRAGNRSTWDRCRRVVEITLVLCLWGGLCFGQSTGHGNSLDRAAGFPPSIQALVSTDDGRIYAGSFGFGVFFSSDDGVTWESINAGLDARFILCLSADAKGTVYAGSVRRGVFRTKEDGKTWEAINAGLRPVEIKSLLVRYGNVYAGTGKGVYYWTEDAKQWSAVASGLEQTLVASLVMTDDFRLFAGTAGRGLLQTDATRPGTGTWRTVGDPFVDPKERLTHTHVRVTVVSPEQRLYVGTQDGGMYQSKDFGKTWRSIGQSLPNDSIRGIVSTPSALYVATGRGMYKNNFQDSKWVPINAGLTELSIQVLMGTPQGELYVGTNAGAFRSRDAGAHWVNISEGLGLYYSMPRPYVDLPVH